MPDLAKVCARPFESVSVDGGGEMFTCGAFWLPTALGKLPEQSFDQVWNSEVAQNIRRSIFDGSFEFCNAAACPHLNSCSGPVGTVEQLFERGTPSVVLEDIKEQKVVLDHGPLCIDCSYDRSCNLSCTFCRNEVIVERGQERDLANEIQQQIIDEGLRDAEALYISGSGDALGSPFFRHWLRTMSAGQLAKVKNIGLGTNALLWTPKLWASLSPHARSRIHTAQIGVDGASKSTYERIRRGGRWEVILKNLDFISELRKQGHLHFVEITMVVQKDNFREMKAFAEMCERFEFDRATYYLILGVLTPDRHGRELFRDSAVHFPDHPLHSEFLGCLREVAREPGDKVLLGGDMRSLAASKPSPSALSACRHLRKVETHLDKLEAGLAELSSLNGALHERLREEIDIAERRVSDLRRRGQAVDPANNTP